MLKQDIHADMKSCDFPKDENIRLNQDSSEFL